MSELPDVQPGEIIESAHINDIADRTVQRYADAAELSALNPTPESGDLAYIANPGQLQWYNGIEWGSYLDTIVVVTGVIEVGVDGTSSSFIDFHSGTPHVDRNARIIVSGGAGTINDATMALQAALVRIENLEAKVLAYTGAGAGEDLQVHNFIVAEVGPPDNSLGINGDLAVSMGNNTDRGLWAKRSNVWQHMAAINF